MKAEKKLFLAVGNMNKFYKKTVHLRLKKSVKTY